MIQNCLIRREMVKKNSAEDGGFQRFFFKWHLPIFKAKKCLDPPLEGA